MSTYRVPGSSVRLRWTQIVLLCCRLYSAFELSSSLGAERVFARQHLSVRYTLLYRQGRGQYQEACSGAREIDSTRRSRRTSSRYMLYRRFTPFTPSPMPSPLPGKLACPLAVRPQTRLATQRPQCSVRVEQRGPVPPTKNQRKTGSTVMRVIMA